MSRLGTTSMYFELCKATANGDLGEVMAKTRRRINGPPFLPPKGQRSLQNGSLSRSLSPLGFQGWMLWGREMNEWTPSRGGSWTPRITASWGKRNRHPTVSGPEMNGCEPSECLSIKLAFQ